MFLFCTGVYKLMRKIQSVLFCAAYFLFATITLFVYADQEDSASVSPVIIELFTSHGCSSCPPADEVLTRLANDPELRESVIPLSMHIDYWDSDSWTDPFSQNQFTERQKQYARLFRARGVYTPQMVFNGRWETLGSDSKRVHKAIQTAQNTKVIGAIEFDAEHNRGAESDPETNRTQDTISVHIQSHIFDEPIVPIKNLQLMLAVFENGLATEVGGGENNGRTLHNNRVVREFLEADTVSAASGTVQSGDYSVVLQPEWNVENLGVAVFLQHPQTRAIHGVASKSLSSASRSLTPSYPKSLQ